MNKTELHNKRIKRGAISKAKVVSIISGKGGVGKSVIAFNLAERIAAMGRRVLLIDADMNFGNLHILTNSKCDYGIKEFVGGELSLSEAITKIGNNFDVLASVNNKAVFVDGDVSPVTRMMKNLRQQSLNYNIILIDHGSGISKTATIIACASDINLLLLVPEITSISDCFGLFKHLTSVDSTIDSKLLINRVESKEEAEYIYSKFCAMAGRFLQHIPEYFGFIPEDPIFPRSIAAQKAAAYLNKESVVVHKLTKLSQKLLKETDMALNSNKFVDRKTINKKLAVADIKE